jgi:predicted GNAT superfamily acetyltransferase
MSNATENSSGEMTQEIIVRECLTIEELEACLRLQREAFGMPDIELSPVRHLIVTRMAGGWTLGAFVEDEMVGFVHHLIALRGRDEIIGYSHMMAVARAFQNKGVGARLKWAQRERALAEGRAFIKWTWNPMQARNAHFNLNRLGVIVRTYAPNFYGTEYDTRALHPDVATGIDSDRLFAEWHLESERVKEIAQGRTPATRNEPVAFIEIPADWQTLVKTDPHSAMRELQRVRHEFQQAFTRGLVCTAFQRDGEHPKYLLYSIAE